MATKSKKKEKNQYLSQKLADNAHFQEELMTLFDLAPPSFLKKSLNDLFFSYLCNTEPEDYNPDIKEIATNIYLLLQVLDVAEMLEQRAPSVK